MSEKKTTLKVPDFMKPIIEDVRLLKSDGQNPNRMTNKQKEELWKSLQEFGWTDPILADKAGVYADGEQRVSVCLAHGEFLAPVYRIADLSDVQRRRLRLITNELKGKHNRMDEEAEWRRIIELGQRDELKGLLDAVGEKIPEELGGPREGLSMIPESYELIISGRESKDFDESTQKAAFEKFTAEGWKVRVLNL